MNILSLRVTLRRQKEAHGWSTYSLSRGMMVGDTQQPRISPPAAQWYQAQVWSYSVTPSQPLPRMGHLVKECLPLLLCGVTCFFQELPQACGTRSWKGSLGCQPVLSPKETGQSDCHLPQPSGRRKLLSKNMFLLRSFHPLWESHKDPGVYHPLQALLCAPAALSGHQSQSFTQLFIILISILPFPSPHYLSLPPKLT